MADIELLDLVAKTIDEEMAQSVNHTWHPDVVAAKLMERLDCSSKGAWAAMNGLFEYYGVVDEKGYPT
jgi:hypothetical protein